MTTPEKWKDIDRIFAAALEREPAERAVFLDEACAGDEELRKEVESLLAHDEPESLISGPAVEEATRLLVNTRAADLPPTFIGPYQVTRSLGAGGMGHVYLAHDERLNRQVAVKLLSGYDVAKEERIRRFRREALAASTLNHPNILTIYEIGETDGHNFIATEFVDGQTLLDLIKNGPVSVAKATDIAIQIASALAAAHAAGIVHRDIKPANLMVRADGLLKVLDFGIAKYSQPEDSGQAKESQVETAIGTVIGTAAYMSPEQARGNPIDHRTDIWSLGVVLYELVTGRRPFAGATMMDVMSAVIERQPLPFSAHELVTADALERIVSKALRKDRDERYQTIRDMLLDLQSLKQELEFESKLERSLPPKSKSAANLREQATETVMESAVRPTVNEKGPTTRTTLRQRSAVIAVAALLIIAAGVGSYFYFMRARSGVINSVAVLPFVNASGNSDLEYLSDGLTESLITSLSQVPKLSVKARTSVFRYKGKDAPPQQLGKELNVQAVLNGRVVQRGDNLTLHIELVDVNTETALWSGDYNRSMTNLVSLPSEIARDVSSKLRLKLSGADEQKLAKNYTANTEAYQLYLKGRFHVFKLTPPEVKTGISYLQQAIEIDPAYALAYIGLSEAYRSLALAAEMTPTEFLPKAKAAAQKAVEIDDNLAEAHTALGACIFWYDWKWNEAENQYKRALELNPNSADTHLFYAHLLSNTGRHAEGLAEIKRARELDPISPFVSALEGQFLIHAGRTDEALERLQKTFELAPNFWFPHLFASSAYIEKGMYREAVAEARRAKELSPNQTISDAFGNYALAKSGKREEARAGLEELLKLSVVRFVPPCHIALIYNGLGETDQVVAWLEKGYEQRDPKMAFLKAEPKWNNLAADPRFQDLLRRVGFPQ